MKCNGLGSCACSLGVGNSEIGLCRDGVDNDCDMVRDCNDLDCRSDIQCAPETVCSDNIDSDTDGLTDCEDAVDCPSGTMCRRFPSGVVGSCASSTCCASREGIATCSNTDDDDCDGLQDCNDSDCFGLVGCPVPPPRSLSTPVSSFTNARAPQPTRPSFLDVLRDFFGFTPRDLGDSPGEDSVLEERDVLPTSSCTGTPFICFLGEAECCDGEWKCPSRPGISACGSPEDEESHPASDEVSLPFVDAEPPAAIEPDEPITRCPEDICARESIQAICAMRGATCEETNNEETNNPDFCFICVGGSTERPLPPSDVPEEVISPIEEPDIVPPVEEEIEELPPEIVETPMPFEPPPVVPVDGVMPPSPVEPPEEPSFFGGMIDGLFGFFGSLFGERSPPPAPLPPIPTALPGNCDFSQQRSCAGRGFTGCNRGGTPSLFRCTPACSTTIDAQCFNAGMITSREGGSCHCVSNVDPDPCFQYPGIDFMRQPQFGNCMACLTTQCFAHYETATAWANCSVACQASSASSRSSASGGGGVVCGANNNCPLSDVCGSGTPIGCAVLPGGGTKQCVSARCLSPGVTQCNSGERCWKKTIGGVLQRACFTSFLYERIDNGWTPC